MKLALTGCTGHPSGMKMDAQGRLRGSLEVFLPNKANFR
jgi:hypothetical protein